MPKKVDHAERRAAFTLAAIDVIAQNGLDAVRLVDIARAAGVTTGSLTHYFTDKDQLIAAALDAIITQASKQIDETHGTLTDRLAAFLPLTMEDQKAARVWLAFFGRAIGNPSLADIHRQYYAEFQARLIAHLAQDSDLLPKLPRENYEKTADAMIAIVDGILVRATLDPEGWPAVKQIEHLKMLLNPLLGPEFMRHEDLKRNEEKTL